MSGVFDLLMLRASLAESIIGLEARGLTTAADDVREAIIKLNKQEGTT